MYGLVAVLTKHSYEEVKKDLDRLCSTIEKKYPKLSEHVDYFIQCLACGHVVMVFTYSEELLNNRELSQEVDNVENKVKERAIAIHYCSEKCTEIADSLCGELIRKCIDRQLR